MSTEETRISMIVDKKAKKIVPKSAYLEQRGNDFFCRECSEGSGQIPSEVLPYLPPELLEIQDKRLPDNYLCGKFGTCPYLKALSSRLLDDEKHHNMVLDSFRTMENVVYDF